MGKLMVGASRFLFLWAVLLVVSTLALPNTASAQQPTLAINPTQGPPGTLIPVLGNAHKAITFLTQMVTLAMQNGGEGQEAQLEFLKLQIEALPKPQRGDRKAARLQNDKGLEEFKKGQHEQALQFFLAAYQLDAGDVEIANNVGMAYLKTGNLPEAARYLGGALSLAPNRAAAWGNLAEVFAHDSHPEESVAAYALTYRYSKNKDATRRLLEAQTTNAYDPLVMQTAKAALALPFISGEQKEQPAPIPSPPQEVERPQQEAASQQAIQSAASRCTGDQIEKMINAGFSKEEIVRLCETTTTPAVAQPATTPTPRVQEAEHGGQEAASQQVIQSPQPEVKERLREQKEQPATTLPVAKSEPVALQFRSIVAGKPEQGWTSYKVALAVVNQSPSSIYLGFGDTNLAQPVNLQTRDSIIETREGKPYPASAFFGDSQILPPGVPIAARNGEAFGVEFKIPELLHPQRLIIKPGVVSEGSQAQPFIFELNAPTRQSVRATLPTDKLPATLRVGSFELKIGPAFERVGPLYWLPKGDHRISHDTYSSVDGAPPTYVNIEFHAKNTDITADSSLKVTAVAIVVIDEAGDIYDLRKIITTECPFLEMKAGPGQTNHGHFCFMLPASHAIKSAPLILSIIGEGKDGDQWIRTHKFLTIDSTQLANCVQNPKLPDRVGNPNMYTYPVVSDKAFSIPGQVSGTINRKGAQRLHFNGKKGGTVDISISPQPPGPSGRWYFDLADPSGTTILEARFPKVSNADPDIGGIPLLCDGTYSLYLHPYEPDTNYTLSVRVR